MSGSPAKDAPTDLPAPDVAKMRQCLRCRTGFVSNWAGERICSRCKSTNAWRNGSPHRSSITGNGG